MQGAQHREGQQRAGQNSLEKGEAGQTPRGGVQPKGAERGGVGQQNHEAGGRAAASSHLEGTTREGQASTAVGATGGAATVQARDNARLSKEQTSRISDRLWSTARPAQTNVNIELNVEEPLPGNVDLMPLPPEVVSIVPEYRDYNYGAR